MSFNKTTAVAFLAGAQDSLGCWLLSWLAVSNMGPRLQSCLRSSWSVVGCTQSSCGTVPGSTHAERAILQHTGCGQAGLLVTVLLLTAHTGPSRTTSAGQWGRSSSLIPPCHASRAHSVFSSGTCCPVLWATSRGGNTLQGVGDLQHLFGQQVIGR
jgi:hypothetical protein